MLMIFIVQKNHNDLLHTNIPKWLSLNQSEQWQLLVGIYTDSKKEKNTQIFKAKKYMWTKIQFVSLKKNKMSRIDKWVECGIFLILLSASFVCLEGQTEKKANAKLMLSTIYMYIFRNRWNISRQSRISIVKYTSWDNSIKQ